MIPPEPERRCPFCDGVSVVDIEPRQVPRLTVGAPLPAVTVTQQCPECRLLFSDGELRRWWEAMEAE